MRLSVVQWLRVNIVEIAWTENEEKELITEKDIIQLFYLLSNLIPLVGSELTIFTKMYNVLANIENRKAFSAKICDIV